SRGELSGVRSGGARGDDAARVGRTGGAQRGRGGGPLGRMASRRAADRPLGDAWRVAPRSRQLPVWGAVAALAAGALLWLRTPQPAPVRVTHARPNQAVNERLGG